MSTLKGTAGTSDRKVLKANGYSAKAAVGRYHFAPSKGIKPYGELRRIPVDVPCPYCHGPMTRLDPKEFTSQQRILALAEGSEKANRIEMVVDVVPYGLWVVSCRPCRQHFTMPTSGFPTHA